MTAALALWALGLNFEDSGRDHAGLLIALAITLAVMANVLFVGDVIFLCLNSYKSKQRNRAPRRAFGRLDFVPEFQKAAAELITTQQRINEAMGHASTRLPAVKNNMERESDFFRKQELGVPVAGDFETVAKLMQNATPILESDSDVMRECLLGFLRYQALNSKEEVEAITKLREIANETSESVHRMIASGKVLRKGMKALRRQNVSYKINDSIDGLNAVLMSYMRTIRKTERDIRTMRRALTLKIWAARSRLWMKREEAST